MAWSWHAKGWHDGNCSLERVPTNRYNERVNVVSSLLFEHWSYLPWLSNAWSSTRKCLSHPLSHSSLSLTRVVCGVVRKLLISLIALTILSIDPRGIPAIKDTSWSIFTNGVRTGIAISNVLNIGLPKRSGLNVLVICLKKLYELKPSHDRSINRNEENPLTHRDSIRQLSFE